MLVRDVMTKNVSTVTPDTSVKDIAKLMEKYDTGCIPVCENDRPVGIVTDRDIVIRNIATGGSTIDCTAKDVMTKNLTVVYPDMTLTDLTDLMANKQIRRVPVIEDNKIVGIVALRDVALKSHSDTEIASALIDISRN